LDRLCSFCKEIASGSGDVIAQAPLNAIGSGSGVVGGRAIQSVLLKCSQCGAVWQRETDSQTMRNIWYLQTRRD
jgi:hypothetical protein